MAADQNSMHNCFQLEESPRVTAPTRVFSRQQEMRPQRLDLNAVIVQMSGALEMVLGQDIVLSVECEQDLPPILGVTNMIKLALKDLCASARQAMPTGGRLVINTRVAMVEESRAGRYLEQRISEFVCLTIRYSESRDWSNEDEAAESLERVYGIAQQHCGWLEVTRGADEATSLDMYLPVAMRSDGYSAMADQPVEIAGGRETILLVEDELDLLSLTREILERYGYRIIAAPSGAAALKIWNERRQEIDLLLTDMRMPDGISGRELAERCVSEKPRLKVIYVSGYSIEGSGVRSDLFEGQNYLTKPYTPPGLAQIIRRNLDTIPTAQAA
jgi:two-component system cell cycle sensor histidine kinase/response regulator CckA